MTTWPSNDERLANVDDDNDHDEDDDVDDDDEAEQLVQTDDSDFCIIILFIGHRKLHLLVRLWQFKNFEISNIRFLTFAKALKWSFKNFIFKCTIFSVFFQCEILRD